MLDPLALESQVVMPDQVLRPILGASARAWHTLLTVEPSLQSLHNKSKVQLSLTYARHLRLDDEAVLDDGLRSHFLQTSPKASISSVFALQ